MAPGARFGRQQAAGGIAQASERGITREMGESGEMQSAAATRTKFLPRLRLPSPRPSSVDASAPFLYAGRGFDRASSRGAGGLLCRARAREEAGRGQMGARPKGEREGSKFLRRRQGEAEHAGLRLPPPALTYISISLHLAWAAAAAAWWHALGKDVLLKTC